MTEGEARADQELEEQVFTPHERLHLFFVCATCGRYITGCAPTCPATHVTEKVDCCAVCASKAKDAVR